MGGLIVVRLLFVLLGIMIGMYMAYVAEEIRLGYVNPKSLSVLIVLIGVTIFFLLSLAPANVIPQTQFSRILDTTFSP
jgi:hypothetical protein